MASSSKSGNGLADTMPVNTGLTTIPGGGTATVLSGPQATQLINRLRSMNPNGTMPQGIKFQTIQTNPVTGAKQIVTVPIQSLKQVSGQQITGSPMKLIRLPVNLSSPQQQQQQFAQIVNNMSAKTQNIRVVKLAPNGSSAVTSSTVGQQILSSKVAAQPRLPLLASASSNQLPSVRVVNASTGRIQQLPSVTLTSRGLDNRGSISEASGDTGNQTTTNKRNMIDFESIVADSKRRKTNEKCGKGLRHFSMKVCEKVKAKGSTSYNEVADELVSELTDPRCASPTDQQFDRKNIRRRVYDALNVLMAMNIISKEKKEIRWLGLPTNSVQEANQLEVDKSDRLERIKAKKQQLMDLILQQISFKNLVERNREREKVEGPPTPNSVIQLPFLIVNTGKDTVIDCRISNDKREYLFNFDDTFQIHDDMEVLKQMGLSLGLDSGLATHKDILKAQSLVPRALQQYVIDLAKNGLASTSGIPRVSSPLVLKVEPQEVLDMEEELSSTGSDTESEIDVS